MTHRAAAPRASSRFPPRYHTLPAAACFVPGVPAPFLYRVATLILHVWIITVSGYSQSTFWFCCIVGYGLGMTIMSLGDAGLRTRKLPDTSVAARHACQRSTILVGRRTVIPPYGPYGERTLC